MRYFDRRANSAGAGEVVGRRHDQRPLRVRLGRSLWPRPSRAPASPSPADLRRDNKVVALGPMLSASDRFRLLEKKSQMGGSRSRTAVPETLRDGRMVGSPSR